VVGINRSATPPAIHSSDSRKTLVPVRGLE